MRGFIAAYRSLDASVSEDDFATGREMDKELVARFNAYIGRIIINEEHVARFLEEDMHLLTPEERLVAYPLVLGSLPKHIDRILAARLRSEEDPRCLERLQEVAAVPRDEASNATTARRCLEHLHASQVLRSHDSDKPTPDRVARWRHLHQISRKHKEEGLDRIDMLVLLALHTEPKDKDLFFKAIAGLSDLQILARKVTLSEIIEGLNLFGDEERARRLLATKET